MIVIQDSADDADSERGCESCVDDSVWFCLIILLGSVASLPWSMVLSLYRPESANTALITTQLSQVAYIMFCLSCSRILSPKLRFRRRISFSLLLIAICVSGAGFASSILSDGSTVFTVAFLTLLVAVSVKINFEMFSLVGALAPQFVNAPIIGLNLTGIVTTYVVRYTSLNITTSSTFLFAALVVIQVTCALFIYATKLKPYTRALTRCRRMQQQQEPGSGSGFERVSCSFKKFLIKRFLIFNSFKKGTIRAALASLIGTYCVYYCVYPYFIVTVKVIFDTVPDFHNKCATIVYTLTLLSNLFPFYNLYGSRKRDFIGAVLPAIVLIFLLSLFLVLSYVGDTRLESRIYACLSLMAVACGYLSKINMTTIHNTCASKTVAMVSASCAISFGIGIGTCVSWFLADFHLHYHTGK